MEKRSFIRRRIVNMLHPRLCELHRYSQFPLLVCIGLMLITISFNYGKASGRKEILQYFEKKNEPQNRESAVLMPTDFTAEVNVVSNDRKVAIVAENTMINDLKETTVDRGHDPIPAARQARGVPLVREVALQSKATVVSENSKEIPREIKTPQKPKVTTPRLPSTIQMVETTTTRTITKLPAEIIDVDKEYTSGTPTDVRWPDDVTIQLPIYDENKPVPKILHLAWYGGSARGNEFKLHHYISFLSAYKRLKPKRILFWYDERPHGEWWDSITDLTKHILQMVNRASPTSIFGRPIKVPEHHSDIVRLEAIMYYGGIYIDLDVIVLKDFEPLYKFPTAMGYEVWYGLCNGIIISKPSAPFLIIWYEKYKSFNDTVWSEHSVMLPARLAKQNPSLIHTEDKTMHKPYWGELAKIYGEGVEYDWSNNYSIHLWYRLHSKGKEHTIDEIKTMNSTFGQISRYTLYDDARIMKKL